jgi:hypothetical protein
MQSTGPIDSASFDNSSLSEVPAFSGLDYYSQSPYFSHNLFLSLDEGSLPGPSFFPCCTDENDRKEEGDQGKNNRCKCKDHKPMNRSNDALVTEEIKPGLGRWTKVGAGR